MISTVAGTGTCGYYGDNQPATAARLCYPEGVAVAADGSVIIADTSNERVRRVTPGGTITTIAGTGTHGYNGDNQPATAADLRFPEDVAVAADGSVLVADMDNHRVRAVAPDGTITTVAGTGTSGYNGDSQPATSARLNRPISVTTVADGSVIIGDYNSHRVRRVALDGTITTVAGTGTGGYNGDNQPATAARLDYPRGVAVAADGSMIIADVYNYRIRRVAADGTISTIAGVGWAGYNGGYHGDNGPALTAQIHDPLGVALAPDGSTIIADTNNHRVRRVAPDGMVTTIAGNGYRTYNGDNQPATSAYLWEPQGVAVAADGSVIIADTRNGRIRRVAPSGVITTVAGTGGSGYNGDNQPATAASVYRPRGVAVAADGGLLVADTDNNRVRRVAPDGTITTIAGTGTAGYNGDNQPALTARLNAPIAVAADSDGGVLISDTDNHRVRRVALDGTITTVAGTGSAGFNGDNQPGVTAQLNGPHGIAVAADGGVIIADRQNDRVRRVAPDGTITTVAGTGAPGFSGDGQSATLARISLPSGVAVAPDGDIVILDQTNQRARRIELTPLPAAPGPDPSDEPAPGFPALPAAPVVDPLVADYPDPHYPGPEQQSEERIPGAYLTLSTPKGCVRPGQTFTGTLRVRKLRRKGNLFVKIQEVGFSQGRQRMARDTTPPFAHTYRIPLAQQPGSTVTIRARATIKTRKIRNPKKSVRAIIRVCL